MARTLNHEVSILNISDVDNDVKDVFTRDMICNVTETSTVASRPYAAGDTFIWTDRKVYRAKTAISSGATLSAASNGNIEEAGSVENQLGTLKQALSNKQDQTLATPTTIDNVSRTTVQDALSALTDSNRVVNNLTSLSTTKSLAARQGKILNESIDAVRDDLTDIVATGTVNVTGATIRKNAYFYLNGTLVRAKEQINNNTAFQQDTNYEVAQNGGLNALSSEFFKNVKFNVGKSGSKSVTLNNNTYGILFTISQSNDCNTMYFFATDSGGYTYKQLVANHGSTLSIEVVASTNQLTINNNDTTYSASCVLLLINGTATVN